MNAEFPSFEKEELATLIAAISLLRAEIGDGSNLSTVLRRNGFSQCADVLDRYAGEVWDAFQPVSTETL
jgi:hypothetical protein